MNKYHNLNRLNTNGCIITRSAYQCYRKKEILDHIQRHANYSSYLEKKIREIPEPILQSSSSPFAKQINSMIREIFKEMDRQRQFTRTQLSSRGILFGTIQCRHHVEDLILEYFHIRFPDFIICLFNELKNRTWVILESAEILSFSEELEVIVEKFSHSRKEIAWNLDYFDDGENLKIPQAEALFNEFYTSQFIKKRENRQYFQKMIPKKMKNHPGLRGKIETKFQNNSLDTFLKKS
ncbi:MAG: DUF4130 domain-containing protein [Candidatus Lokiarchaeota archaeon]|nr:DUF4130 domain-containing protein [Candidatus Harpocratesius repetitus]